MPLEFALPEHPGTNTIAARRCACGYPDTPCNKQRHSYGHDCVKGNEQRLAWPRNDRQWARLHHEEESHG